MSRGVDVLAVMDRALSACEAHTSRTVYVGGEDCFKRISDNYGLPEARAAVAELIEVASQFDSYTSADFGDTSILDNEDLWNRLSSALARVRGAE